MCKSRIKNNISILNIIGLVCIYVLLTAIFPNLRIPFSFLKEEETDLFNHLVEALAVGYLSSVLLYYLTIIRNSQKERKRRLFEIYDLFEGMRDAVCVLENELGKSIKYWNCDDYTVFTVAVRDQFCYKLSSNLEKLTLYKDILTKQEQYHIYEIRKKYKEIEAYNEFMESLEIQTHYAALINVCNLIDELTNTIIKELPHSASC